MRAWMLALRPLEDAVLIVEVMTTGDTEMTIAWKEEQLGMTKVLCSWNMGWIVRESVMFTAVTSQPLHS